jgi:hypothetical protein
VKRGARKPPQPPIWAKLLFSACALIPLLFAAEGAASLALAWKDARDEPVVLEMLHCQHDPDLGWSNKPLVRVKDLYGQGRTLTTNSLGLRSKEEYEVEVPEGRYRVICAGDSFTLGYGVDDAATYEAELEAAEPRLQAVNMGQGGYGVDQAYLWYKRDGAKLEHNLLLFAFIAPDFERMLDERFNDALEKPVLRVHGGELAVENVPVPEHEGSGEQGASVSDVLQRLKLGDLLRRFTRTPLEEREAPQGTPFAFRETAELMLADLKRLTGERKSALALVQIPLRDRISGRPQEVAAWLRGASERLGVPFLDLSPAFDALPPGEIDLYYQPDGHLNALGNRLLARLLLERLPALVPGFPVP